MTHYLKTALLLLGMTWFGILNAQSGRGDNTEGEENYTESDYQEFYECYVIAGDANLRSAPIIDEKNIVRKLKFGDKFYMKNDDEVEMFTKVYLTKPTNKKNPTEQVYYAGKSILVDKEDFENYKINFSLAPFLGLSSKTKKLILSQNYYDGNTYHLTQNADRSKNVIAYADYDSDKEMDIAILIENTEKQFSRLLIISTNKMTEEPYLAFVENYSDLMRINAFKKGAKVFMYKKSYEAAVAANAEVDENGFSPSPNDGLIVQGEDVKLAIIYSSKFQKYKTYYQE